MSQQSIRTTPSTIHPLEQEYTGLPPNARELFGEGYSWQHPLEEIRAGTVGGDSWAGQIDKASSYFLEEKTCAEASLALSNARRLISNTDPHDHRQKKLNEALSRIAFLSRATMTGGYGQEACREVKDSYTRYQQFVRTHDGPAEVQSLMQSLTTLAREHSQKSTNSQSLADYLDSVPAPIAPDQEYTGDTNPSHISEEPPSPQIAGPLHGFTEIGSLSKGPFAVPASPSTGHRRSNSKKKLGTLIKSVRGSVRSSMSRGSRDD